MLLHQGHAADTLRFLREAGCVAHALPLFDPRVSPRNLAIVAHKRGSAAAAATGTAPQPTGADDDARCEPCIE